MNNGVYVSYKRCSVGLYKQKEKSDFIEKLKKGNLSICGISGRTVLSVVLQSLGMEEGDAIAIPEFYPQGIDIPIRRNKITKFTYGCNDNFTPRMNEIFNIRSKSNLKAVLAIHYFGQRMDLSELDEYCINNGIYLIEDCAQALDIYLTSDYSYRSIVLYSFTKFMSIPDGAMAVFNIVPINSTVREHITLFSKSLGLVAVFSSYISLYIMTALYRNHWNLFVKAVLRHTAKLLYSIYYIIICKLSTNPNISSYSMKTIDHINYKSLFEKRAHNSHILLDQLINKKGVTRYGSIFGVVLVCEVELAREVNRALIENGINTMRFKSGWYTRNQGDSIFKRTLLLPVNEHLDFDQMRLIARVVNRSVR